MRVLNEGRKFEEKLEKEKAKEERKRSKGWPVIKEKK